MPRGIKPNLEVGSMYVCKKSDLIILLDSGSVLHCKVLDKLPPTIRIIFKGGDPTLEPNAKLLARDLKNPQVYLSDYETEYIISMYIQRSVLSKANRGGIATFCVYKNALKKEYSMMTYTINKNVTES